MPEKVSAKGTNKTTILVAVIGALATIFSAIIPSILDRARPVARENCRMFNDSASYFERKRFKF